MRLEIGLDEINSVIRTVDLTSNDQSMPSGWIIVHTVQGRRHWASTSNFSAISFATEPDDRDYVFYLTPSNLIAAWYHCENEDDVAVIEHEGTETVISCGPLRVVTGAYLSGHPLEDEHFGLYEVGASATFSTQRLKRFASSQIRASISAAGDVEMVEAQLHNGQFEIHTGSRQDNQSVASLAGSNGVGAVSLHFDPTKLHQILELFADTDEVELRFPLVPENPIVVLSHSIVGYLMPMRPEIAAARIHVLEVVQEVCGSLATESDDDGNYSLRRHGNVISGKLVEGGDSIIFRVAGTLLNQVKIGPELMEEINHLNMKIPFAKLGFQDDHVVIHVDLLAPTLDAAELVTAIEKIIEVINEYAEMFAVVFGGDSLQAPEDVRWGYYLNTIIDAEVAPSTVRDLNGPDGIEEWLYPSLVHVISGYNPQGVDRDGSEVNARIAADVFRLGGRCTMGKGRAVDGSYSEPSVVIWGLTRDQAQEIGQRAEQDAIFEITADEVRVVQCVGNRVESNPRLPTTT